MGMLVFSRTNENPSNSARDGQATPLSPGREQRRRGRRVRVLGRSAPDLPAAGIVRVRTDVRTEGEASWTPQHDPVDLRCHQRTLADHYHDSRAAPQLEVPWGRHRRVVFLGRVRLDLRPPVRCAVGASLAHRSAHPGPSTVDSRLGPNQVPRLLAVQHAIDHAERGELESEKTQHDANSRRHVSRYDLGTTSGQSGITGARRSRRKHFFSGVVSATPYFWGPATPFSLQYHLTQHVRLSPPRSMMT